MRKKKLPVNGDKEANIASSPKGGSYHGDLSYPFEYDAVLAATS